MSRIGATMSSSRAAALAVSLGLHALVAWAVSSVDRPGSPMPRPLPIMAYLAPMPPAPIEAPLLEPLPEDAPVIDDARAVAPEPAAAPDDAPLEPDDEPAATDASDGGEAEGEPADRPARNPPRRRDIDWNVAISRAIARVREREQQRPRSFGRALPESGSDEPRGGSPAKRLEPWQSQRPGETIATGPQQVQVNETCHYEVYLPGSPLEEAHRFSNSLLNCRPSGPAEPRNDLFRDARPAYLDLHLAEEAAENAQSRP